MRYSIIVKSLCITGLLVLLTAGCGTQKPVLYHNAYYKMVGEEKARKDIEECESMAEAAIHETSGTEIAKSTAGGAAAGAVIGGAVGAVTGELGRGVGVGAAAGGASGIVHGVSRASQPSPVFKQFVERCLREKGYEPVGWK